ncbi:MAG: 23S rRNA (uracil(1939)-C(5))-methyltransferase RlmD [Terriglobales bacterium]
MELTIEKLIYGGDGLARLPADEHGRGKAVFVPFVLEGEKIEALLYQQKKGFARGWAKSILQASPHRIEPPCPYFQRCGGCHYQHASYEHQLEIKAAILKENLLRIAKLELPVELKIHPSPPWNYRNRTRLKVRIAPEFAIGYYRFNSHELFPVEQCPISSPLINRAIAALWQLGRSGSFAGADGVQEIEFFANADDAQLLLEAYCASNTPTDSAKHLSEILLQALPEVTGVVAFKTSVPDPSGKRIDEPEEIASAGAKELTYKTKHASYRVSAGAFFQVNRYLTDELVSIVTGGQSGKTVLDLYAGGGLFSSVLNREFERVIAVESSQTSHIDLVYNSPANVKAVHGTTAQYLKNVAGKLQPDLVVVDPPRSGLGEDVVKSLASLDAPRMVYVSCDPATLARDMGGLLGAGYRVEQAHLVDLFPQTYHLESVLHLVRQVPSQLSPH